MTGAQRGGAARAVLPRVAPRGAAPTRSPLLVRANQLTLVRVVLTAVCVGLVFVDDVVGRIAALGVFAAACATDGVDGVLARRRQEVTEFGILMDPLADKVLVLAILVALAVLGVVPRWMVVAIVLREVLLTGLRVGAAARQRVFGPSLLGKYKTCSQMVAILTILAGRVAEGLAPDATQRAAAWAGVTHAALWVAVGLTLGSGLQYLWRYRVLWADARRG